MTEGLMTVHPGAIGPTAEIIRQQWGHEASLRYVDEALAGILSKRWTVFAALGPCEVGVGALVKLDIDYDLWSITWLVVHQDYRRRGIGRRLVCQLELQAVADSKLYPGNCAVMELTTTVPEFYEVRGYRRVAEVGRGFLMVKNLTGVAP